MIDSRIQKIIDIYCGGSKSEFAQKVGIANSVISNIMGTRKSLPSFEVLEKIIKTFPQLSCEWLLMGTGQMNKNQSIDNNNAIEDIDTLKLLVKAQQEVIELQKRNNELISKIEELTSKQTQLEKKETTAIKRD